MALMALAAQANAQTFLLKQSLLQAVVIGAIKAVAVAGAASVGAAAAAAKGQEKPADAVEKVPTDSQAQSEPAPASVERLVSLSRSDAEFTDAEKAKLSDTMPAIR